MLNRVSLALYLLTIYELIQKEVDIYKYMAFP